METIKEHLFATTVVANDYELLAVHSYILEQIEKQKGKARFLTKEQVNYVEENYK